MRPSYIISAPSYDAIKCDSDNWWFHSTTMRGFQVFLDARNYWESLQSAFTNSILRLNGKYFLEVVNVDSQQYEYVEVNPFEYFIEIRTANDSGYTSEQIPAFENFLPEGYGVLGHLI